MSILRRNDNPAQGRRVLIEHEALKVGYRGNGTYYNGTLNVDVIEEAATPNLLAVVDTSGSYAYRQDTQTGVVAWRYNNGTKTTYEVFDPLYHNFVRIFTIRRSWRKILDDPLRFEVYLNATKLRLQTDPASIHPGVPLSWVGRWTPIGRYSQYYVSVGTTEVPEDQIPEGIGTINFNLALRSLNRDLLQDNVMLRIRDSNTNEWLVRALFTYTPSRIEVGVLSGVIPVAEFDFYLYKGKRTDQVDSGNFYTYRLSKNDFDDYMASVGP